MSLAYDYEKTLNEDRCILICSSMKKPLVAGLILHRDSEMVQLQALNIYTTITNFGEKGS